MEQQLNVQPEVQAGTIGSEHRELHTETQKRHVKYLVNRARDLLLSKNIDSVPSFVRDQQSVSSADTSSPTCVPSCAGATCV